MGSILAAIKSRKNKQREKNPAPGAGLIAGESPESRETGPKTGQNARILTHFVVWLV
jgi:hypothetical protein